MNRTNFFETKHLMSLILFILAVTSCQDEPLFSGNQPGGEAIGQPVRFEAATIAPGNQPETRGVPVAGTEYPDGGSFGVSGYRLQGDTWQENLLPDFMYNKAVTRNGNTYSYEGVEYWPADKIRFFAYHPFATAGNGITLSPATQPGAPVLSFQVKPVVTEQVDLLLSATAPVLAPEYVTLPFSHGLTRITFLVRKNETNRDVKVISLTLKNIIGAGSVSLTPHSDGRFNWTPSALYDDITEYMVSVPDANGSEQGLIAPEQQRISSTDFQNISSPNGTLLLIPQQITAGRSLLVVHYTIDGQDELQEVLLPATSPGSANEWLSGKYIQFQLTIKTDNDLEEVTISTAAASANCIMLDPVPIINPVADFIEYSIPVLQANRFYGDPAFAAWNGNLQGIAASDAWGVNVIWMDQANLLSILKNNGQGTGDNSDGRFIVRVPSGTQGNALIGIYKDKNGNGVQDNDEPWLWSWHLWITNYNPNRLLSAGSLTINSTDGEWDVPNGKIHRYQNGITTPVTNNNGDYGSMDVWTPGNGLYAGLAMMDRNIGSISASFAPLENNIPFESANLEQRKTPLHVLYYQYGRKDPFLSNAYRYRENGSALNTVEMYQDQVSILFSIQNPEKYVRGRQTWANDKPVNCYWYDPRHTASLTLSDNTGKKSIFDPCPAGWRLPVNGTWSDFSSRTFPWSNQERGRIYTPIDSEVRVYYPANGFRNASQGLVQQTGYHGVYWSCSPLPNNDRDYCFRFSTAEDNILEGNVLQNIIYPSAQVYQTDSFSVRCVQDRESSPP